FIWSCYVVHASFFDSHIVTLGLFNHILRSFGQFIGWFIATKSSKSDMNFPNNFMFIPFFEKRLFSEK
ncbi:hypothetical protein, partial [Candidatus Schmidhempelia bombi]|uniref:hypothetical protein n=1 Tax=Candidatus Schmidhempelia bombi TaxID=1505866 RepID=UPI001EE81391